MNLDYAQRIIALYLIQQTESPQLDETRELLDNPDEAALIDAATYLSAMLTLTSIRELDRDPVYERDHDFDMLSVYQCFASLIFVFITQPLRDEDFAPDLVQASAILSKSLFSELSDEACAECLESGLRKLQLVGKAEQDYLIEFREQLDRAVIAFVIAGTDNDSPIEAQEIYPMFAALLNILCETFSRDI